MKLYKEQHPNANANANANGGANNATGSASADKNKDGALAYPVARIRKICRLDPEVKGISKEATLLITKAAEIFTCKLGEESNRMALMQKRRKLVTRDVVDVVSLKEQFFFLKEDLLDLIRVQQEEQSGVGAGVAGVNGAGAGKKKVIKPPSEKAAAAAANTKPLTSFFSKTK